MKPRTHYTQEEVYRLVLAAQLHPEAGYNGESFWKRAIKQYGPSYFCGRTAAGLRQKWRSLIKDDEIEDLYAENAKAGKQLGEKVLKGKRSREGREVMEEEREESKCRKETDFTDEASRAAWRRKETSPQNVDSVRSKQSVITNEVGIEAKFSCLESKCEKCENVVIPPINIFGEAAKPQKEAAVAEVQCDLVPPILTELSQNFSLPMDEVLGLLHKLSGSVSDLERHLNGEQVEMWTELEDIALKECGETAVYKYIESSKGSAVVKTRRQYLGLI